MDAMVEQQPLFCDITWGAGGSTADLTLDIAAKMQNQACAAAARAAHSARWGEGRSPGCGAPGAASRTAGPVRPTVPKSMAQMNVETMMHLTCTNMPKEKLKEALDRARPRRPPRGRAPARPAASSAKTRHLRLWNPPSDLTGAAVPPPAPGRGLPTPGGCPRRSPRQVRSDGLQNILALRGDPPKGETSFTAVEGGYACALDLVRGPPSPPPLPPPRCRPPAVGGAAATAAVRTSPSAPVRPPAAPVRPLAAPRLGLAPLRPCARPGLPRAQIRGPPPPPACPRCATSAPATAISSASVWPDIRRRIRR